MDVVPKNDEGGTDGGPALPLFFIVRWYGSFHVCTSAGNTEKASDVQEERTRPAAKAGFAWHNKVLLRGAGANFLVAPARGCKALRGRRPAGPRLYLFFEYELHKIVIS